jgi:hypothetical protein
MHDCRNRRTGVPQRNDFVAPAGKLLSCCLNFLLVQLRSRYPWRGLSQLTAMFDASPRVPPRFNATIDR